MFRSTIRTSRQSPESGPKFSADPRSTVFFKSVNPLNLSLKSAIRAHKKAKSANPQTYSPPSQNACEKCLKKPFPLRPPNGFSNVSNKKLLSSIDVLTGISLVTISCSGLPQILFINFYWSILRFTATYIGSRYKK